MKGKIKKVSGKGGNNPKLKTEGAGEKIAGKVQKKIVQVEEALGIE